MAAATVKGALVQGILENIAKRHGAQARQQLVDRLAPDEQIFVCHQLSRDSRVPAAILRTLYDAIKEFWGQGKSQYYSDLVMDIAEQNINTFLKFLISLGLPSYIANSVPQIYSYYADHGEVVMISNTRRSIEFYIKDGEPYGEALCAGIIGWGIKGLQMAGASNIRVEHQECLFQGGKRCHFIVRWD
ncbi:hypothetical protein JW933_05065 [candidate division FCPU426 bacterium]|nr:hypothetical protein [candidate division FCPU426 bacterium]